MKTSKTHLIGPSLLSHFLNIIIFIIIYSSLPYGTFSLNNKIGEPKFIDYFNLSTTIQAGVGVTNMMPVTTLGKFIMALQQILMITKNVVILYFFTRI
jgi:hypothetical protein